MAREHLADLVLDHLGMHGLPQDEKLVLQLAVGDVVQGLVGKGGHGDHVLGRDELSHGLHQEALSRCGLREDEDGEGILELPRRGGEVDELLVQLLAHVAQGIHVGGDPIEELGTLQQLQAQLAFLRGHLVLGGGGGMPRRSRLSRSASRYSRMARRSFSILRGSREKRAARFWL